MTSRGVWRISKAIAAIMVAIVTLSGCWAAVRYLSAALYKKMGWELHSFFTELINMMVGFILFFVVWQIIFRIFMSKEMRSNETLTDAMRRIAKGDFKVRLYVGRKGKGGPYQEIISEMNHMVVELDEMEQLRQDFISDVSHEIQSPLTSISGFARALQNSKLSSEQRDDYLRIIESESVRLSKLSDNLLKLGSLDSDKYPFEPKRYRLDRQVGDLILTCEPQWEQKSIEMNVELDEVYVTADEDLMTQVWINLLSNSIKFTPQGGSIDISLRKSNQEVLFIIRDTGVGISLEDQKLIFQRFYKVDKSRNRKAGGSGLGLSLVQKIVQMNKGNVTVSSELGKGSEFVVRLPTADPHH